MLSVWVYGLLELIVITLCRHVYIVANEPFVTDLILLADPTLVDTR